MIVLRAKQIPFEVTYIDLRNKPDWFLEISPHGKVPVLSVDDQPLFESLRMRRLELAREQGVPPYVIFHDSTLREMASLRPRTLEDLGAVNGVGEKKLDRFGSIFIDVIRDHPSHGG